MRSSIGCSLCCGSDHLYAVYAASGIIVFAAALRAHGTARVRSQWFACGFACWIFGNVLTSVARLPAFAFADWFWLAVPPLAYALGQLLFAYPIVRHDLFGVGFIINRAAIYAVITGFIVGIFAGGNWLIGSALKSAGLALPVDVALAAIAGLSLNLAQRRANLAVDRVFFRRRYDAARRLRRVARALNHATDAASVADAIVLEPCEALGLRAAAFFAQSADGMFRRMGDRAWPADAVTAIFPNDRFVMHLIGADENALRMDDLPHPAGLPHGALRPRTVVPLWSRRELVGFAFYSAHVSGAMLDPEEITEIELITSAASAAFDRVAAAELRQTQEQLVAAHAEIARLRALTAE